MRDSLLIIFVISYHLGEIVENMSNDDYSELREKKKRVFIWHKRWRKISHLKVNVYLRLKLNYKLAIFFNCNKYFFVSMKNFRILR